MSELDIGIEAKPPSKSCKDQNCPWHGQLPVRGKILEGEVTSVSGKTAIVRREYFHPVPKYERDEQRHSKIPAHLPGCISLSRGDKVKIAECRRLSKTKSFVVIQKLKSTTPP